MISPIAPEVHALRKGIWIEFIKFITPSMVLEVSARWRKRACYRSTSLCANKETAGVSHFEAGLGTAHETVDLKRGERFDLPLEVRCEIIPAVATWQRNSARGRT